ncbi:Glucose-6-phosphate 3-dehydrogenase [Aquisphaera giovannonii]|uniref:Glucose-6-phosphate 3-dehydrogenase n=2 Tax=Aquisphaera giovannonii TaxID=406548 RepID=A0A5B9VXW9_9BACT|nr:Glucose-6-phosphate 3-dehydrogenase [Aquisphaera giovannonii]
MVGGGGPKSFFGAPHRRAILMDNTAELTAGALRSNPEDSLSDARELFFARGYPDWRSLVSSESALPEGERIDYLTIVTPNDAHFGPAEAALGTGIAVLSEKPLTTNLDEARQLQALVLSREVPFLVAHTYTGYPMVMLARELVMGGAIGEVRKVEAWYRQGWLSTRREADGNKQASWRADPAKAGASGCGGDIGTHAYIFIRFAAGLHAVRLLARMKSVVPGRPLDDDFTVLAELNNGAIATVSASQITTGAENDNGVRIIGTTGTLTWSHIRFDELEHCVGGQPVRIYRQGADTSYLPGSIRPYLRLPAGHPEGFHEALANLHRTLEWTIRRARGEPSPQPFAHPGIADGVAGMAFIEAAVQSARGGGWVDVPRGG